jgi:L-lactate dehydrogenase complex protein LldF
MVDMHAPFQTRITQALDDRELRATLRVRGPENLAQGRSRAFADAAEAESIRTYGKAIRKRALARLPELLLQLEETCTRNGVHVHWAETAEEACGVALEMLRRSGSTSVVKGKSMATEEIHLNAFLEEAGCTCLETDLGEYIVQLAAETPSHLIAPALHKNQHDIAALLKAKAELPDGMETAEEMAHHVRARLRQAFQRADAGITGVNFAVAETGTICLVENEGNGRMSTTVPNVHVAVMGIEKVVEKLEDLPALLSLVTRSCTGQLAPTYFNMISGPRRSGEKDGPREVHLLIFDNRRSNVYQDEQLRQTLQCIRCGACYNVCPVYRTIGGHAYGTTYAGPLGTILSPQLLGMERAGELTSASTLCGACADVCPVKIPIPEIIVRLRTDRQRAAGGHPDMATPGSRGEARMWRAWAWGALHPAMYRAGGLALRLFSRSRVLRRVPEVAAWLRYRTLPTPPKLSLRRFADREGLPRE